MSRTINTMPLDIQRLDAAGLRPPHDIRARSWGQRPNVGRWNKDHTRWLPVPGLDDWYEQRKALEALANEINPTFWQKGYGGAWPNRTGYARQLNRRYRAQTKDAIRNDDYDRIGPIRREAAWLIW